MGADIHGFIECRARWTGPEGEWAAAVDLDLLYVGRSYDAFDCLFGVRNHAGFVPLAAERGLPELMSEAARTEFDDWGGTAHSPSWIGWNELKCVDWDEQAEITDRRIHEYEAVNGTWVLVSKAAWSARFAALAGLPVDPTTGVIDGYGRRDWPEGTEWRDGDRLYRVERMIRRDAVPQEGEWQPVWSVMEALAAVHGDGNVRLTVWFDN
ncbi:hypothetical protein [Streptomyces brevispora]|uniref:Barstar (barnase inhibitor) domain-containing protein n=1 Tax=Streptomyces brevispora TaxID=887462 RepID=A0ABZ1G3W3_9ACTN|nr:hypothetical protein [Streptomyces brevispora]WSC14559.1 hypothetical protein OIE64_18110 [Streptomyces brevispora]